MNYLKIGGYCLTNIFTHGAKKANVILALKKMVSIYGGIS